MRATQIIAGDRDIKNLTPSGLNIGGRIVKNMRIAGSGVYQYHRKESALFGLDESFLPGDQEYFYMYRPPEVLDRNRKLFARVPIITGRHVVVDQDNAKELAVGMVGDSVESEVSEEDGELYLYTTGTIVAGDGIEAYENYGQLSVGYSPKCEWRRGVHNGTRYDAVLLDFKDVNHLLICPEARGGPQCTIMDSLDYSFGSSNIRSGGTNMLSLFKKRAPTVDARVPILLQSIAVGADPTVQVNAIRAITNGLKLAGDTRTTWDGYLEELTGCKNEMPEVKAEAIGLVERFYSEKIAGDMSTGSPEHHPEGAKDDAKGKPDDKAAGDADKKEPGDADGMCPGCHKDPCICKKDDKSAAGDAVEQRFVKIEQSIDKLVGAVGQLVAGATTSPASTAGDAAAKQGLTDDNKAEPGAATTTLAGDNNSAKKQTLSDFMSILRG